ncbi:MAG: FG-GAP-like repeat-containing protein [Chitinophagales bacterium]|nr:FG-GAP-like repeat-containing protein [Chitinophagales bacterium]
MKSKSIFLTMLLACCASFLMAQGTWIQKADFPGAYGDIGFSIGTKGYVLGGSNLWQYDALTDEWTQVADFGGTPRDAAVGFSVANKGYVGLGSWSDDEQSEIWEYDPATNTWLRKADFPGGARTDALAFSIGNKGYVGFGNYEWFGFSDFWEYDPVADSWTYMSDYPGSPRTNAVGFSIGEKGYAGLGWDFTYPVGREFFEFDPNENTWTAIADFPVGGDRSNAVGFSSGTMGGVGGGYVPFEEVYFNDLWEYNPIENTWIQRANCPCESYEGFSFSIGSQGYVLAGGELWQYTPEPFEPVVPVITSFTPTAGPTGTSVEISGRGFSSTPENNIVYFGSTKATVTSASPTSIVVIVPDGVTYDPISVTVAGLTAYSAQPFDVTFDGCSNLTANSFATPLKYTALNYQWASLISDLDGDGKPDMATIGDNPYFWLSVFRNTSTTGTISFEPRIDIPAPNDWSYPNYPSLISGDIDGDGKIDLVFGVFDETLNWLGVYRNTSSAESFAFDITYPITGYDEDFSPMAKGDFDVDGKPDIVYRDWYWDYYYPVYMITRNISTPGNIAFGENYDIPFSEIYSIDVCDFNGDGKPELTCLNGPGDGSDDFLGIRIFRNTGTPGTIAFDSLYDFYATGSGALTHGDFDGDGKSDLVYYNSSTISVFRNSSFDESISFESKSDLAFPCIEVKISDVNGDGTPDILARSSTGISVFLNTSTIGTISFADKADIIVGTGAMMVGDLDGDGRPEICQQEASDSLVISVSKNQCGEQAVCTVPTGLNTINVTSSSAKLQWDAITGVDGYQVRYRVSGLHEWTSLITGKNAILLKGLLPNTGYAWQVRTVCSKKEPRVNSDWTVKQFFMTSPLKLGEAVSNSLEVYPNPFQQSATITYSTANDALVQIALYDLSGKLMKMLLNENVSSGMHTLSLSSEGLSQGIYFLKFQVNDELMVKKVAIE